MQTWWIFIPCGLYTGVVHRKVVSLASIATDSQGSLLWGKYSQHWETATLQYAVHSILQFLIAVRLEPLAGLRGMTSVTYVCVWCNALTLSWSAFRWWFRAGLGHMFQVTGNRLAHQRLLGSPWWCKVGTCEIYLKKRVMSCMRSLSRS